MFEEKGGHNIITKNNLNFILYSGRKLVKKRKELGDDVSTSSDSELVSRRPKSETPLVDVSKLRKERDKKYQSQPLELLETSSSIDFDSWRRDHSKEQSSSSSPDSDKNNTREQRQLKFKSQPEEIEELSNSWDHRMYDSREYRPRASAPPLGFDDEPGPSRRRDYLSGPPVGEPPMDYDEGRSPEVDRQRQMPSSSRDDSARYYRRSQMPPADYR